MPEVKTYISVTKFSIGLGPDQALQVSKGTQVDFDGITAVIGGESHRVPTLQSAISVKWLVLLSDVAGVNAPLAPISANIKMRHPTDESKESKVATYATSEDEAQVGSVQDRRNRMMTRDTSEEIKVGFHTKSKSVVSTDSVSLNHDDGLVNTQRKAQELLRIQNEKLERELEELRSQLGGTQVREGVQFRTAGISASAADTASGSGNDEIWDGGDAKVVSKVGAPPDVTKEGAGLAMARLLVPDFEWDFSAHWKTKIKTLEEKNNPLYVTAAYAVEGDSMRKNIAKAFPHLIKG